MRLDHLLSKEMEKVGVVLLLTCQGKSRKRRKSFGKSAEGGFWNGFAKQIQFPVTMRLGDTPVLIPNTMVKTLAAEGTILETIWEIRRLPDFKGA